MKCEFVTVGSVFILLGAFDFRKIDLLRRNFRIYGGNSNFSKNFVPKNLRKLANIYCYIAFQLCCIKNAKLQDETAKIPGRG